MIARQGRVLIVEDEILIGMAMMQILEQEGYEVSGPFGQLSVVEQRVDLRAINIALLDVNLGDGNTSFPLARKLLKRGTPVIFLTGYAMQNDQFKNEFDEVPRLSKPCERSDLLAAVETHKIS